MRTNKNYIHKRGPLENKAKAPLYLTPSQKRFKDMGMVELQHELNEIFRMRRAMRRMPSQDICPFNTKVTIEVFRAELVDNKRVLTFLLKMRKALYNTANKSVARGFN